MGHVRTLRLPGLAALSLVGMLVLAGCGGGGSGGAKAGTKSGSSAAAAGLPVSATSLKGWTVSVGTGNVGPTVDTSTGDPTGPSLKLPGDDSYVWADPGKAVNSFSFDAKTQGLFDFVFGAAKTGQGYMFRIDTRGSTNYSGFAEIEDWAAAWDCPQGSDNADPANTWIHVAISISGANATATETWSGGKNTFPLASFPDGCTSLSDGTTLPASITSYKPYGTVFGFDGDGLGPTSYTWIANFK